MDSVNEMQDDNPWKPPAESGRGPEEPTAEQGAPSLPSIPPPTIPPPVAAEPVIPPPPLSTGPAVAPTDWSPSVEPGISDDVVVRSSEPAVRSQRSKWLVGGAVAAVLATGAAGVFAVSNLTGGVQGGAATPDELGLSLLQAIENEDVLGVVDVLSPGERDVFRDPLVDLVAELTRLEVLSPEADLSRILGLDVELSNERVSASSTNVPDITNIDLRADAVLTFDGAELPIGELITDNVPADLLTEMRGTRLTETDELDVRLTAVEEDGRWYFSVFHTIAELARQEAAPGMLIPIQGIGSDGADTPDAAFEGMLDRVEDLDLTGLLRTLNPGEAAALQRYAPLFLDEAEAALAEVPLEWKITRREFRVDESGDTATVFLDAVAVEGSIEGDTFSFEFAGDCVRASMAGESFEQCNQGVFEDTTGLLDDAPATRRLLETITDAFSDMEASGLEMRRTDDLWYVSPSTTASEAFLNVLRALDRSELDAIIEQAPAAGDEFFDAIFGSINDLPGSFADDFTSSGDDSATAEPPPPFTVTDEPAEGTIDMGDETTDGGTADPDASAASWEDCYSVTDPGEATACFETAVDAGEIDLSFVPLALRYPECGYTQSWAGSNYDLSDEEFIAGAEAARPCFLDLVAQGVVSEWELPTEIANLECFEGRNWYNVFDDPDYDERYFACLDEAYQN